MVQIQMWLRLGSWCFSMEDPRWRSSAPQLEKCGTPRIRWLIIIIDVILISDHYPNRFMVIWVILDHFWISNAQFAKNLGICCTWCFLGSSDVGFCKFYLGPRIHPDAQQTQQSYSTHQLKHYRDFSSNYFSILMHKITEWIILIGE